MEEKRVDEDWKTSVEREKRLGGQPGPARPARPEGPEQAGFTDFLSSLGMQAMMALGLVEHPMTHRKEQDLGQAKYLIDTLELLQQKTAGNLTREEQTALEELLYGLRLRFVEASQGGPP